MIWIARSLIGSAGLLVATWLGMATVAQPEPEAKNEPAPAATTQPTSAAEATESEPGAAAPAMPTAEDVVEAFERERPTNVPIPPSDASASSGEEGARPRFDEGPRARLPDGFLLIDRTGRLVRDGDWWTFAFEANGGSLAEPPMKLLPNRMLERMIFEVEGARESVVFLVSGEITEFEGENYLLLRKLLRRRNYGNLSK